MKLEGTCAIVAMGWRERERKREGETEDSSRKINEGVTGWRADCTNALASSGAEWKMGIWVVLSVAGRALGMRRIAGSGWSGAGAGGGRLGQTLRP